MSNPEFYLNDDQWSQELENKYEEYMWDCEASVDGEESDDFKTLSGEPFCGCTTCYTREQLFFLVPKIIKAYKEGKIVLAEDEATDVEK
jgi:hypothetical protein